MILLYWREKIICSYVNYVLYLDYKKVNQIYMINRPFWVEKINDGWGTRPLVWLSGVRRSGKTTLCRMLPNVVYMNCDLPSVKRQLENPEFFFSNLSEYSTVIFDEIHRLENPSEVLKIGTDEFPNLKILATGSSTLEATSKFRDSLTGRKIQILLPPVLWNECVDDFKITDIDRRLLNGGLPEFLLSEVKRGELYSEWIDSYYARDIQEIFGVRNRTGFLKLMQLLFMQSGGIMEVATIAKGSGLSRPTVMAYLEALSVAHAISLIQPFYGGGKKEIVKRPKVYAFDTGFVCHVRGWNEIRETDRGFLWEHLVLDMLRVRFGKIYYWSDKYGNEIDFIVKGTRGDINTFECKINPDKYSPSAVTKFREYYPEGEDYCISPHVRNSYKLSFGHIGVTFQSFP